MSNSSIITIAEAIAASVKLIPGAECAVMELVPEIELPQVTKRQIMVTPVSLGRKNASRGDSDSHCKIGISIMEKIEIIRLPDMIALTENIGKGIERLKVGDGIGLVTGIEFDPIYDVRAMRTLKVFISVCMATVKVLK